MSSAAYSRGVRDILNGTVDTDTTATKIGLAKSAYTPNKNESSLTTFASSEADATNYTGGFGGGGRKAATVSITENAGTNVINVFTDLTWTALGGASNNTLRYAVWLKETTNDAGSTPLAFFQFTADLTTNGSDVLVDFATSGAGGQVSWTV